MNQITLNKAKEIINYTIDTNLKRQEKGLVPIAVGIEGEAGIGKTEIIKQIAKERDMQLTKLNISMLDEVGDITGFPCLEYECQIARQIKDEEGNMKWTVLPGTTWLNSKQIDSAEKGMAIKQTGKSRMGYAKPAWVPEYNKNGTILLLDDFVRGNQQLLQAVMDLVLEQKYISWKLPEKTTIVLTNNPDSGTYNVNSLDEAQRGRFMNYTVEFDADSWAEWAEKVGIDGRCINFVLSYANELFSVDEEGNRVCTPRSYVMFANMINGIDDWDNAENLSFITTIARGCFKDEEGRFANMFNAFIRGKMHQLIQPKSMLLDDWDKTYETLVKTVYDDNEGMYRPDISALLERRFSNFVSTWLSSDAQTPISKVETRIIQFLEAEEKKGKSIFTKDQFYHMIKTITSNNKRQTNKLLFNPKIAQYIQK